jgi:quercetin dioxygenase-like cupin family protein
MPNTESELPSPTETAPASTSGCCGGPAPAGTDACCVRDAESKAGGSAGCGCGCGAPAPSPATAPARAIGALLTAAVVSAWFGLTVAAATTQDPLVVSPDAYRLEFENAWVKVVRVTYGPKAIIAPHLHTERASAYVYLNDGGPILFKHEGLPYEGVTRPATKAGSFRVYKGIHELHSVENPSATPSDFLRVEFKTEPLEDGTLKGKFFREDPAPTATAQQTQFENAQIRVTRVRVAPGGTLGLTATGAQPTLLVALSPTGLVAAGGSVRQIDAGKVAWLEGGHAAHVQATAVPGELLRFDFKSSPMERR